MKKRLWSILLVACMVLTLLPFGAFAAGEDTAPEVVWMTRDNDTVLMVSCDGEMPNYSTARPAEWSKLKSTVKTVIVEKGATTIGENAFNGFTALESVSIPDTVKNIGAYAFNGCTKLESVTIPDGVARIETGAFNGCSKLATLTLAQTVKTIKQNAFKGTDLKDVYFGGTEETWKTLTLPANTETGNEKLTGATRHVICTTHKWDTVNYQKATCTEQGYSGDQVCSVCGTAGTKGDFVKPLGHDWKSWKVVTAVSASQDGMEQRICYNDEKHVETVKIPAGTVYAPAKAELLNEANKSLTVPNTRGNVLWLAWIAAGQPAADEKTTNPFSDVSSGSAYYEAVLWALDEGLVDKDAKTLNPSEALTRAEIAEIADITLTNYPDDVVDTVSYLTDGTEEWVVPVPTEVSVADFTFVISTDKKTAGIAKYKGSAEKVAIPEKVGDAVVTAIRDEAFMGKNKMTEVTIPDTVTSIGDDAFNGCAKLENVSIPAAVTSIGDRAFQGCAALTKVEVPEGVATIGNNAFANCGKLESATLPKSLKSLAADAFAGDNALKDIYFKSGKQDWIKLGNLYSGDTPVTVHFADDASPLTWEVVDGKAIVKTCSKDASGEVVIPETLDGAPVAAIAADAFKGCNKITSVVIPEGVTTIGEKAFENCTSLKTVTLPKSLVMVDKDAFDGTIVKDVNYGSTKENWANVAIKSGNDVLKSAAIHYADCVTHDTELKNVKPATCEEKGYSGDEVCKVCGKTIKAGEEVAALGHDWGEWTVTKAPTATEKGEETRVCKRDASHTEKRDVDPSAPSESFVDVNTGDFFYDAVVWAVNAKPVVTTGIDTLHFNPYDSCTRAQMVTFLWRAAGEPDVAAGTVNPFTDVPANEYFYKAVLWAVQEKITTGTSATTFSPYEQVTRAQTVTFLWRYAKSPVVVASNPFTDVPANEYYTNAVLWAVQEKITNGKTATTFEPNTVCTRGEIVTFLYRDLGQSK